LDNPEVKKISPNEKNSKIANKELPTTFSQSKISIEDEGFIVTKKQPKKDNPAKIIEHRETENHRKVSINENKPIIDPFSTPFNDYGSDEDVFIITKKGDKPPKKENPKPVTQAAAPIQSQQAYEPTRTT
jgi:hypothetical protein